MNFSGFEIFFLFFFIRDIHVSRHKFHALRRGKKFEKKRRAYFSKNLEIVRRMEASWISSFETCLFRPIKFQFLFRRIFKDQISLHLKSLPRGLFARHLIARSRAISEVLNEIRKHSGSRGFR